MDYILFCIKVGADMILAGDIPFSYVSFSFVVTALWMDAFWTVF